MTLQEHMARELFEKFCKAIDELEDEYMDEILDRIECPEDSLEAESKIWHFTNEVICGAAGRMGFHRA